MVNFFIDRPIFAWVLAIVLMLAGVLAIKTLPVSQYPTLAPPAVSISANYPGASAKTLENTVTQIIEQQMNGLDNLMYMSSQSDSSGNVSVSLTFLPGTDPDIAQVQVQNKLSPAMSLLPQEVQQQGVRVAKASTGFLLLIGFYSPDGSMSKFDLSDYLVGNIQDPISRLPGVGSVTVFGSQYSMRIWLDPYKLNTFKLSTGEVKAAIRAQNVQISSGQLGDTPAVAGQELNATIISQTRLQTPEEFENILLRVNADGSQVRLKDVARVELGGENYQFETRFNKKPATALAVQLATGANALETATGVRAKMEELKQFLPHDMAVVYPYDTTPFVKLSIEEVVKTLCEAVVLVFLVMYLFLQNIRATIIPTLAVPVVLLGTFAMMAATGFSINTLTMFGLVLAIGLLVDDAIVVVENVERVMREEGLSPREATRKSMGQITGALVGIALVLSAVFVPMAFFGGSTGAIYRQFSLTIVSAMVLSVLVAMILTPALCATILKPIPAGHHEAMTGFFGWFNRSFNRVNNAYQSSVEKILRKLLRYMMIYGAIFAIMVFLFFRLPTAFLPNEDQGILFTQIQTPAGSTQERTLGVIKQVEEYFLTKEKETVDSIFTVAGFSFSGRGQNTGIAFVKLKDWDVRQDAEQKVGAIAGRAMGFFSTIKGAMAFAFAPPAVIELGNATGFDLQLQDRGGLGHEKLLEARNQFLGMAAQSKILVGMRPNGQEDMPQFKLEVDLEKASAFGVPLTDISDTISTAWGSSYVNDFIDKGRVKKVYAQGDTPYRMLPSDLDKWYVKNKQGEMIPFSAFSSAKWIYGASRLERYNGLPSMEILGQPAPGKSSGEAMAEVEKIAKQLPPGIGFEWTGASFQEKQSGTQAPALYAISLLVVFLCLAALYESWSIPFSVLLVVPLGIVGALLATSLRGLSNDVYFQVGLLTTMGLAAKNAILIVEFAKELQEQGQDLIHATLHAVKMRLRPILMTSLAFMLGVLPLAISNGAGSGSQHAIGTGVLGGMISATILAIFLVPVFFVTIRKAFPYKPPVYKSTEKIEDHR
jgi:multidrug efflux pump